MSQVKPVILAGCRPANLPLPDNIVKLCRDAGYDVRGIPLIDESRGVASAWVKYGLSVTMGEALTQDWVGQALNASPEAAVRIPAVYLAFEHSGFGYIVMEYIDGPACDDSDALRVAAAVECLIRVKSPNPAPGPVGGGPIKHRFFVEWNSFLTYSTVQLLEDHVNGILKNMGVSQRVSFNDEGLCLCPCDLDRTNFKKGLQGKVVALDFGATCFLPPSFFAFAMAAAEDRFTRLVAQYVKYPASSNLEAMLRASYYLVPFGTNNIGVPSSLKPKPSQRTNAQSS